MRAEAGGEVSRRSEHAESTAGRIVIAISSAS